MKRTKNSLCFSSHPPHPSLILNNQCNLSVYWAHAEGWGAETYVVQFIVQAAGVAHRVSIRVAPPESGGGRLAVGTTGARSSGSRLRDTKDRVRLDQNSAPRAGIKASCTYETTVGPFTHYKQHFSPHGEVWRSQMIQVMWGLSDELTKNKGKILANAHSKRS